ncbi:MFS transporter [Chelativorans sp. YIM 93263]|uniref:MFS transporter n=1 Tax=Chelativorans sp. YIM 93263 TaxID=2906648 RepID=UPI0023791CF9|nr:MFS transporter [Chelativorans sp. YIM 93263]
MLFEFSSRTRKILSGTIANVLEWYDFAIYGILAITIAPLFFPSDNEVTSLIATFGVFAAGFMMRPLGGLVLGHVADKLGRSKALTLSVALMAVPTTLIAILPTYQSIGLGAPLLLTLARLLQGLSVGGAYTGSVTFLVENAPKGSRALSCCWSLVGSIVGLLLGSAIAAVIAGMLTPEQMATWGWRLPFAFGIVLAVVGIYLRRSDETGEGEKPDAAHSQGDDAPIVVAVTNHGYDMLRVFGINVLNGVGFYIPFVYLTTYLVKYNQLPERYALDINTLTLVVLSFLIPLFAYLSDRIGRRPVMLAGATGMLFLSYPLFWLLHHPSYTLVILGQLGFAVVMACFLGGLPAAMAEMFPRHVRMTAYSVAFNIPIAVFGGTTPLVATYLIGYTHYDLAPAFYAMAAALVTLGTILTMRETFHRPLR